MACGANFIEYSVCQGRRLVNNYRLFEIAIAFRTKRECCQAAIAVRNTLGAASAAF
jgi:hypothetical protein